MGTDRRFRLDELLRKRGLVSAADIARALGVSQPTVSRLLAAAGDQVVAIGRARRRRYALTRALGREGQRWPLYRINSAGHARPTGRPDW